MLAIANLKGKVILNKNVIFLDLVKNFLVGADLNLSEIFWLVFRSF